MRRLARLFAELPPTENANAASPSTLCGRLRAPISDRACPILFTGQRSKPSPFVRFSLSIILDSTFGLLFDFPIDSKKLVRRFDEGVEGETLL